MEQTVIVGVDVSKSTLDICIKPTQTLLQIPNTALGFKELMAAVDQQSQLVEASKLLVIMEHTGLYSRRFEKFLQSHHIGFCKIPSLQIKRSLGAIRGKNDKIDAVRIAEYGWLRKDILQADEVLQDYIEELHAATPASNGSEVFKPPSNAGEVHLTDKYVFTP